MDIDYVYNAAELTPSSSQITITGSTFTDNKADGDGGLMKINANIL